MVRSAPSAMMAPYWLDLTVIAGPAVRGVVGFGRGLAAVIWLGAGWLLAA
jgi:hypothetical protein